MQPVVIKLRDVDIIVKPRSVVILNGRIATKTYYDPADLASELHWYRTVPWACPQLIDHGPRHLVMAAHPVAADLPDYQPADQLCKLLLELEDNGIHHFDVHPGNIVWTGEGPKLIDWESAIHKPGCPSYDLYGPDVSGVPPPAIHRNEDIMWWNADHESSIRSMWGVDVNDLLGS